MHIKTTLAKHTLEFVGSQLTQQVSSSPLYSFCIETNADLSLMYVYIKFINHGNSPNWPVKRLIKVLEVKEGINEIKLSKYLFEQLKLNVIQQHGLNKQNLMCLCLDSRLLDKLCFSTLQLYLSDLFNSFMLILPLMNVETTLCTELNGWSFCESFTFKAFFDTYAKLYDAFRSSSFLASSINVNFMPDMKQSGGFKFELISVTHYLTIAEWVYTNYAQVTAELAKSKSLSGLHDSFNSLDFYFMTCLFCDLFKFLLEFTRNAKHLNNFNRLVMTWNAPGSYLYKLISEQLIEDETTGEIALKSPLSLLKPSSQDRLGYLAEFKNSLEEIVNKIFDLNNSHYQAVFEKYSSHLVSQSTGKQLLEIYKTLFSMFDINLECVCRNETNGQLEFVNNLSDTHLENVLEFYEFKGLIQLERIKEEQKQFFEKFFQRLTDAEKEWLLVSVNDRQQKSLFGLENRQSWSGLREKFIAYVYENNKSKFVPVISFLATNYLCLPSIVSLNQLQISHTNQNAASHSWLSQEHMLKLLNSIKSPIAIDLDAEYCGVELSQVPFFDIFL